MSQSPIDDFSERTVMRYRQGWKALNRLLHEDRSFSGHERNCAFLNTRGGSGDDQRFADVSAASGWDFDDDGRAVALCDWDFDGDLDIWVTNRTAPRVRLMRNNSARENHFIAIKLQGDGQGTNRDAIGARVEVSLSDESSRPLIKTLAAGDGFLSQSSSWLHFGLGDATNIKHVTVRWPGGQSRQYANVEVDRRYLIDQSSDQVEPWAAPEHRKPLVASAQEPLTSGGTARTVLPARRLLPTLEADGVAEPLNDTLTRPTLVTIWSATCGPCIEELQDYTQHAGRLREAGLDVIAINLDNLEADSGDAQQILARIGFPFRSVSGTLELVRSLDILKRAIFDRWQTLTVPTSLLVDAQGYVGVWYQGRVAISQVLADLELLQRSADKLREYSSPFPGRWMMPPPTADPLQVTTHFIDEAMVKHGIEYLERHAQIAENRMTYLDSQEPGDIFYVLAILLRDQEQIEDSLAAFRKAIEYRPNDFRFRDDFASLLAMVGRLDEAAEQLREALQINPRDVAVQRKLAFLHMAQGDSSAAIERFTIVVNAQPKDVACWYNLANAYRVSGQLEKAIETYRRTLTVNPAMTLAANNLAWILATHPQAEMRDGAEAVRLALRVCEQTNHRQPAFLDTLACAYAENGQFEQAVATANRAIQLLTEQEQAAKSAGIQARLRLFQTDQPYRDE